MVFISGVFLFIGTSSPDPARRPGVHEPGLTPATLPNFVGPVKAQGAVWTRMQSDFLLDESGGLVRGNDSAHEDLYVFRVIRPGDQAPGLGPDAARPELKRHRLTSVNSR